MADDFYEVLGVESGASEQVRIKKKMTNFTRCSAWRPGPASRQGSQRVTGDESA